MILVFGARAIARVKQSGVFHCRACGPRVRYKWKRVRNWGHLFWIPLIPAEILGEYVECQVCRARYDPEVLKYADPDAADRAFRAAYEAGVLQVLVRMMLASGSIDAAHMERVRAAFLDTTGRELEESELTAEIHAAVGGKDIARTLTELEAALDAAGKAAVYAAAHRVASGDRELERAEAELLLRVGMALRMSMDEMRQAAGKG